MKKTLLLFKFLSPAIASVLLSSACPAGAQSLWSATNNVSVNTNWSNAANWSPSGVPGATSNVLFSDRGATTTPGIINNVVDVNTTIQQLSYRQTNGVHNTLILPGVTLTISNVVAATNLLAGTENTADPTTLMVTNTISGPGGTLTISGTNAASLIVVRQITSSAAGSHLEVLDMSGLDRFNATVSNLWVGVFPGTGTTRPQGQFLLAKTNVISVLAAGTKTTPSIDVGDTGSSPDAGNVLALGITNDISADTIVIGNQRSGASLIFNPAFTNGGTPSLCLRGYSNPRVATFNISDNSSATANIGSVSTGLVDFSGGTVDAMINSMTLGYGQPITGTGAGTTKGTLTMTAGTLNVNTLQVAVQNNTGVTAANTGTVNVNGGTLIVNTSLILASYGGTGGLSTGTLNITNGTVQATNIVAGGGTSTINLSGGTLIVTNTIGTLAAPLSALNVNNGATLQFSVNAGLTPVETTSFSSDSSGVIKISSLPSIASYAAQFPLITYQGGSGSGVTFSLASLPGTFTGFVSNDNSSTIWLVITNGPSLANITWGGGVNDLWDTASLNWTNNGSATKYQDLDVVNFNDSAQASTVNVTATFTPSGWTVTNNSVNYTFTGAGSITGSGGLIKNGSASVMLTETGGDSFRGGVQVNAGTVVLDDANSTISGGLTIASGATAQIGNHDANGILPFGALDDEGTLIFSRTDNVLVGLPIAGAGALTQNGSGILTLSVSNAYTGNTTVTAGTLALTNAGSIASSAQINVTGGTLDVSGVSGITTLTSLNLANAGLTVKAGYPQTNLFVNSLTLGGSGNVINVSSLPVIASYPTALTLLQSAGTISGFNLSVGTLPAGYTGGVALSGDSTAVVLTLTSGPVGLRSSVTWSGEDALKNGNTNWSDNLNWQLPGAPIPTDSVIFNNSGAVGSSDLSSPGGGATALTPGAFNNFVDRNFTIASLDYTNNEGSYQNTGIATGATLTITNAFTVGAVDSASTAQQQYVNLAGTDATLDVTNAASNLEIWIGASGNVTSEANLDLSALDNFTANISRLTVGACAVNNAVNRPAGILYLAKTNTITCSFQATSIETGTTTGNSGIVVGDANQNAGPTSTIYLGQVNIISADSIGIARQKSIADILFNPIYINVAPFPSVTFKGFSSALVSNFDVGDGVGNTGTTAGDGDLNLLGGFVTAAVGTMNIGSGSSGTSGTGTTSGSMEFDAGTITANTVNIGFQPVTGSKAGVGTVSVNTNTTLGAGAVLVVNGNLNLGVDAAGAGAGATVGTLNINGGTVQAGNILVGTNGAQSVINLNAGSLIITGIGGTPAAPISSLNFSPGTTLEVDVNGGADVTNIVAASLGIGGAITLQIGALGDVVTGITYPLISYTGSDPYSSLNLVLPSGYAGSLVDDSSSGIIGLTLTTVAPTNPPRITAISVSGTTLNISATNGVDGGRYVLLGTTNVAKPLSQWTPLLTNNFNGSGDLNLSTNIINPAVPQQFFILSQ